jgi:serine phosphatase RsbU (regulator of sigma subunit)
MVGGLDPSVEERMRAVMATGTPVSGLEIAVETVAEPGVRRTWLEAWYPVRDATGEVAGLGVIVNEMTGHAALLEAERAARARAEAAEQRFRFLARAGEELASSLDLDATLQRVTRLAVPAKADWCGVDLVRDDGTLERVALSHSDREREKLGRELQRRWPPDRDAAVGAAHVVRTGLPQMLPEITDELLAGIARDPEHLDALRGLALSGALIVPLLVRGETIGALTFGFAESGRRPGAGDLELAREIARRAAAAIDNARLYRERDHIARVLQRSLLPPRLPDVPGFELAARYRAAGPGHEVGGDFYDVFPTSDSGWSLIVGDVCGKGPEAAALTSLARYTARAAALVAGEPREVLRLLDAAIVREHAGDRFMTAVCAHLELGEGGPTLELACGGHPPPVLVRADGRAEVLDAPGPLIGLPARPEGRRLAVALAPGDAVAIFTDGLTEAAAPRVMTTAEELARQLDGQPVTSAADLAGRLDALAREQAGERLRDDVAIVVLRHEGD